MSEMEGNPGAGSTNDPQTSTTQNAPVTGTTGAAPTTGAPVSAPATAGSWRDALPEALRESKSLQKFETVNDLALGYTNAESLIGRDKIPMPKTEAEFLAAFDRLGRPKTSDGYELVIEGGQYDEATEGYLKKDLAWFQDTAHSLGLTKAQAQKLFAGYMGNFGEAMRQQAATVDFEMRNAEATLQREFGRDYKRNMAIADRALAFYASPELIAQIETSGLGRNPDFVKMMHKLGTERHEDIGIDKGGNAMGGKSLAAQIEDAMADPAYMDSSHPLHKQAVQNVNLLFQQAHPE